MHTCKCMKPLQNCCISVMTSCLVIGWQAAAEASKCDGLSGNRTDSSSDASKLSSKSAKERRNHKKKRQRQGEGEKEDDVMKEGNDRKASFRFTDDGKFRRSRERTCSSPHQVRNHLMFAIGIRKCHQLTFLQ